MTSFTKTEEDWHYEQKAIFAAPDTTPQVQNGRVFTRTFGKRCPWCLDVFFAYEVEGNERQPYQIDPEPLNGHGVRETCGHPKCHEFEEDRQFKRRRQIRIDRVQAQERAS